MQSQSRRQRRAEKSEGLLGDYITPTELAAEFGICLETLKRWHRAGKGKAPPKVMIGRSPYYSKTSVLAWIHGRESAA